MTAEELNNILYKMTYMEYAQALIEKYGKVPKDYFYTNKKGDLSKTQGITRGSDGLYIHHIYECYFLDLSDPMMYSLQEIFLENPQLADAQKAENLCYCNLLEHLILHMKIAFEYARKDFQVGINLITDDLNRLYELGDTGELEETYKAKQHLWKRQVYYVIKDDYSCYVELAKLCIFQLHLPVTMICGNSFYNTTYTKLYNDVFNYSNYSKEDLILLIHSLDFQSGSIGSRTINSIIQNTKDTEILYELLKYAYYYSDIDKIFKVLQQIGISDELFVKLSKCKNSYVRELTAKSTKCPIDILTKLALDKRAKVRVAVIYNKQCPIYILNNLKDDPAVSVRKAVKEVLQ